MLLLDRALTVKIQKNDHLLGYYTHQTKKQLYRYPPKVPSKSTNSELKTYKTVAVRSHFKIRSHFFGNPVVIAFLPWHDRVTSVPRTLMC